MEVAALAAWILSAVVGMYLMAVETAQGGLLRQPAKVTRFPALLTVGHPLTAVVGLAAWAGLLATGRSWYAWTAFVLLVVVIIQGFLMFTRWLEGQNGGRHAKGTGQDFPGAAIAVHSIAAVATLVLVFLTATRAGAR